MLRSPARQTREIGERIMLKAFYFWRCKRLSQRLKFYQDKVKSSEPKNVLKVLLGEEAADEFDKYLDKVIKKQTAYLKKKK